MSHRVQLREVFTPGGLPSVTYVSRDHLELEKRLSDALDRGFAFIVVTGPTKSGKSVLCRRVLEREPLVIVEGGQIRTEADFWTHIAYQLKLSSDNTRTRTNTSTTNITGEGGAGIPGIFQAKTGATRSEASQITSAAKFDNVSILAAVDHMLQTKTCLMVDDFHYLDQGLQKSVIQSLKGPVFKGLPVVLIAVPHRAFDPITVEHEVEGRFKHIAIPQWALDDLLLIPRQGFPALNIDVERSVQRKICEDSFGKGPPYCVNLD